MASLKILSQIFPKIFEISSGLIQQIFRVNILPAWMILLSVFLPSVTRLLLQSRSTSHSERRLSMVTATRAVIFHVLLWYLVPPIATSTGFQVWMPGMGDLRKHDPKGDLSSLEKLPTGTVIHRKTNLGDYHSGVIIQNNEEIVGDGQHPKLLNRFQKDGGRQSLVVHFQNDGDVRLSCLERFVQPLFSGSGSPKGIVNTDTVASFVKDQELVFTQEHKCPGNAEIYARAEEKIGERSYNIFLQNCQHMASYIATGSTAATGLLNVAGYCCVGILTFYLPLLCALDVMYFVMRYFTLPVPNMFSSGDLHFWIFIAGYTLDTAFEIVFRSVYGREPMGRRWLVFTVLVYLAIFIAGSRWLKRRQLPRAALTDFAIIMNLLSFYPAPVYNMPSYREGWTGVVEHDDLTLAARIIFPALPYICMLIVVGLWSLNSALRELGKKLDDYM